MNMNNMNFTYVDEYYKKQRISRLKKLRKFFIMISCITLCYIGYFYRDSKQSDELNQNLQSNYEVLKESEVVTLNTEEPKVEEALTVEDFIKQYEVNLTDEEVITPTENIIDVKEDEIVFDNVNNTEDVIESEVVLEEVDTSEAAELVVTDSMKGLLEQNEDTVGWLKLGGKLTVYKN